LTALALWPVGHTWGGGGIFLGPHQVGLAHGETEMKLAPELTLPNHWRVEQLTYPTFNFAADGIGHIGSPIECIRLMREGWEITPGTAHRTFRRRQPGHSNVLLTTALFVHSGRSDERSAEVSDQRGRVLRRFDVADWVEFSHQGDLLIANGGCLYRLPAKRVALASDDPLEAAKLVADLRPLTFRQHIAPAAARRW
jgi:hypothetical protein